MSINHDLDKAIIDLAEANGRLAMAEDNLREAQHSETAALNSVNQAQKRIDELMAGLKKSASRKTDWRREPGLPVATREHGA